MITYKKDFLPFKCMVGTGNRNQYSEGDIKLLRSFSVKRKELKLIKEKLKRIALDRIKSNQGNCWEGALVGRPPFKYQTFDISFNRLLLN